MVCGSERLKSLVVRPPGRGAAPPRAKDASREDWAAATHTWRPRWKPATQGDFQQGKGFVFYPLLSPCVDAICGMAPRGFHTRWYLELHLGPGATPGVVSGQHTTQRKSLNILKTKQRKENNKEMIEKRIEEVWLLRRTGLRPSFRWAENVLTFWPGIRTSIF